MAGIAAVAAACLLAIGPATASADTCEGSNHVAVTEDDLAMAERSLLCLVNSRRGLTEAQALRMDTQLLFAARAHSTDMVTRNYFSHVSPEGVNPRARATDAGYPADVAVGEIIARSSEEPTAFALFQQIINSAIDDELMRRPGFQTVGIGLALGTPGGPGVTMTLMIGTADTKASDTAVDLFSRSTCEPLTERLLLADARFAKKDRKVVRQARVVRKLEEDGDRTQLAAAKRKLRRNEQVRNRAGKALQLTYEAAEKACAPRSFRP